MLGTLELHTRLSQMALREDNRRGIFDNLSDTKDGLRQILSTSFETVDMKVVGSVAGFNATKPRCQSR